jgi:DNA-binding XRE family transcriptional regulator
MTFASGKERHTLRFDYKPCEMHVVGAMKSGILNSPPLSAVPYSSLVFHRKRPGTDLPVTRFGAAHREAGNFSQKYRRLAIFDKYRQSAILYRYRLEAISAMSYPVHTAAQLSAHLKSLRAAKGLSQAALGKLLGVGQVRIAEIEKDPGAISVDQLIKILQLLDTRLMLLPDSPASQADVSSSEW